MSRSTPLVRRKSSPLTELHADIYQPTKRLLSTTTVLILSAGLAISHNALADEPHAPPKLSSVKIPLPSSSSLAQFIKNRDATEKLGKALFWDMAVGSDGVACASCHFHAGADNRSKNQLNPGTNRVSLSNPFEGNPDTTFQMTASGGQGGPNYTLKKEDFPFHQFHNPDSRSSGVKFTSNDIVSSHGTFGGKFLGLSRDGGLEDICSTFPDPIFHVGGTGVRKVEPRNAPSMINSVFNFRNFWDGRANNIFNGVDSFGKRNRNARVFLNDGRQVSVDLRNGSLAGQADGTVQSNFEMVCANRSTAKLGEKLIPRRALSTQKVHFDDSELGSLVDASGLGLSKTYNQMIRDAFRDEWWSSYDNFNGFSQMEANFSLFFGLSIKLYQATLISDDAPYDRFARHKHDSFPPHEGDLSVLTSAQERGLDIFLNKGKCINCHKGSEFSGAASVLQKEEEENGLVERMRMGDNGIALYDQGFYNIGVTPTSEDIGVGARDPFGNPLSFTKQYVDGRFVDPIRVDACTFEEKFNILDPHQEYITIYSDAHFRGSSLSFQAGSYSAATGDFWDNTISSIRVPRGWKVELFENDDFTGSDRSRYSDDAYSYSFNDRTSSMIVRDADRNTENKNCHLTPHNLSDERIAVMGAFKVPILRNVELTGPYMHNGSMATLEQVVDFYNRGGNFRNRELDADIRSLGLSSREKSDLVAFMKALTDERVAYEKAPFDHPQLFVPNGQPGDEFSVEGINPRTPSFASDDFLEIPAVGRHGRELEGLSRLKPFLNITGTTPPSPEPYNGPKATFYEHWLYGGAKLSLQPGRYDIHDLDWWDDQISSVRVPHGMKVELFEHPGFSGSSRTYSHDESWVGSFNDRTSSIIVHFH